MTRAFHSTSRPRRIREWAGHFVVYGFGTIALNALSFLVVPIYTHRIAPAEYGVLEMLNRGQEILVIVVMSGLGLAALAFHQFESENPDKQKKVFSTALLGVALNAALLFSVLCPFSDRISVLLFGNEKYAWAVRA